MKKTAQGQGAESLQTRWDVDRAATGVSFGIRPPGARHVPAKRRENQ
jgi:hypothetical protein